MQRICRNCRYFVQVSVGPTNPEHVWGDCVKPQKADADCENNAKTGTFTWATATCVAFEFRKGAKKKVRR